MRQFGRPAGLLGRAAGQIMAVNNRGRSLWVISLLDIQRDDRVLEIGFGPGVDLRRVSEIAADGFVAGVDHSKEMVRQASKRNAAAIRAGRVELKQASASAIPYPNGCFDKILAINSIQFWPDSVQGLKEAHRLLKPGGLIAIALQPRSKDATEETALETGKALVTRLRATGFSKVRQEIQPMRPVSTVCALGVR